MRKLTASVATALLLVAAVSMLQLPASAKGPAPGPTPTPTAEPTKGPGPTPTPTPPPGGAVQFVFASGLDHGPVSATAPGMHETHGPGVSLDWQSTVARTGMGAYHAIGGNLQGDHTIDNSTRALPLGGLEIWAGGAFRFTSFPRTSANVWLLAAVPTDGVVGADDKPIVSVSASGRLRLAGSNSGSTYTESRTVLATNHWYDLVLHGRNGVAQVQQLFIYDGLTDALIERLDLTLTVTGSFKNPLTKWGFGTSQDSTGLDYYLDDIFHARGSVNPGPIRVFTRNATGTQGSGFSSVGAPTGMQAVDDCAFDDDLSYIASGADAGMHVENFALAPAPLTQGNSVYAVQMFSVGRSGSPHSLSAQAGISLGTSVSTVPISLTGAYQLHRQTYDRNPLTGQPWTIAEANAFGGLVRDTDAVPDQMRFTAVWWEVVYGRPTAG
jgi:hypothetical protein